MWNEVNIDKLVKEWPRMAWQILPTKNTASQAKTPPLPGGTVEANLGSSRETTKGDKASRLPESRRKAAFRKLQTHEPGFNPATRAALSSVAAQLSSRQASGREAGAGVNEASCRIPSESSDAGFAMLARMSAASSPHAARCAGQSGAVARSARSLRTAKPQSRRMA